jgi:hypothetical protein
VAEYSKLYKFWRKNILSPSLLIFILFGMPLWMVSSIVWGYILGLYFVIKLTYVFGLQLFTCYMFMGGLGIKGSIKKFLTYLTLGL